MDLADPVDPADLEGLAAEGPVAAAVLEVAEVPAVAAADRRSLREHIADTRKILADNLFD